MWHEDNLLSAVGLAAYTGFAHAAVLVILFAHVRLARLWTVLFLDVLSIFRDIKGACMKQDGQWELLLETLHDV